MKNISTLRLSMIVTIALLAAACTHGKTKLKADDNQLTKNQYVDISAVWLKDKGNKYDVKLRVLNVSKNDIIIMLNDMQCYRGPNQGALKHTFFNTGERTIDFRAGQVKEFQMVCNLNDAAPGEHRIVVNRIFDNPESDGATKGKVLANKIEWKAAIGK